MIQGQPGKKYSIDFYTSATDTADYSGLEDQTADENGFVKPIKDNTEILEVCRNKIKALEIQKERLITERASNNDFQQKALIQQQIDEIQSKIVDLQDRLDFVGQSLLNNKSRWLTTLEKINSNLRGLDFPEVKASLMDVKLEYVNLDTSSEGIVNVTEKVNKVLQEVEV